VLIYDTGETEGTPYIAMEYISGPSLAELLRRAPLPVADISAILSQVAAALDYAHRQNILHRILNRGISSSVKSRPLNPGSNCSILAWSKPYKNPTA
jgi:serine/threonine protein kinase